MFNAPLLQRVAKPLAACALTLLLSSAARCQIIDLSLNVYYDVPTDINSGGQFQLVAKSTNFGIASMNINLANINLPSVTNQAPRGVVNGSDPAGFGVFLQFESGFLVTQQPTFPTSGQEETAFYGVGTIQNGEPGDVGPALTSLTDTEDVPWAPGDLLDNDPAWAEAATLLSGTFNDNVQPGFGSGNTGRVFTTVGTSTMYGHADPATITFTIRDNLEPVVTLPDYNRDEIVDAADYIVWRKGILPLADSNNDNMITDVDYDEWREHFGEIDTLSGGGAGTSAATVPEPASALLLFFALIYSLCSRPKRSESPLAA
jgi:hypothetical protein